MDYSATIEISKEKKDTFNKYLTLEWDDDVEIRDMYGLKDGDIISVGTAKFSNGYEVDIRIVVGSHYCFTDPVLFDCNGNEVVTIEDDTNDIEGNYVFDDYDNEASIYDSYLVTVIAR